MGSSLKKIIIVLFVVGMIVTSLVNMKINSVEIVGNTKQSDMEILSQIFENEYEKNSIYFYLRSKFFEKNNMSFVSSYDVVWKSPFNIVINIHEKPSVAFFKRELKNIYFDRDGIINEVSNERYNNMIEISGIEFINSEMGKKIDLKDKKLLKAILNIVNVLKENSLPVRFLQVENGGNIKVFVGGITVELGNTDNMEIKLDRLNDIYKEIKDLTGVLYLKDARENMLDEHYIFKKK